MTIERDRPDQVGAKRGEKQVWLYHRFCLSFRDVEDLLAERGITGSYEAIRRWCRKFGADYAQRLKKKQGRLGDTWYLDELFVRINGRQQYLWRAVDQDGDVIDILLQSHRDQVAAERFLARLLRGQRQEPFRIVTDKKSYQAARRIILPGVTHDTQPYAIALSFRTSPPERENDTCVDSNLPGKLSAF